MEKINVIVFDMNKVNLDDLNFYKEKYGIDYEALVSYDKSIVKNGWCKGSWTYLPKIQPLEHNCSNMIQYCRDLVESTAYSIIRNSTKQAQDLYDSCKRKEKKYEHILVESCCKDLNVDYDNVIISDEECNLSIIGKCVWLDGNCIFCEKKRF